MPTAPIVATLRRVLAHRTVTAAAALTVLLASLTFAVLATTVAAVPDAGTRAALRDAPVGSTAVVFTASPDGDVKAADPKVEAAARRLLRPYPVAIQRTVVVSKLDLTAPTGDVFVAAASADNYAQHIRLAAGTLLTTPGDVLIPDSLARQTGLAAGGSVIMAKALWGATATEKHRIAGVYQTADNDPLFWGSVRPVGAAAGTVSRPLIFVTPDILAARDGLAPLAQMTWYGLPDLSSASASGLSTAVNRILAVESGEVNRAVFHAAKPSVLSLALSSGLPMQNKRVQTAETAGMSGFLIVATLLAVLAIFALALTLRLVREHSAEESRLVQARGAHPRALVGVAAGEMLLIAFPAVLITAFATGPLARGLRRLPRLHAMPAPHAPELIGIEVSILIAVFCLAVQAGAAYLASRERIDKDRTRSKRVAAFQRAGIDAALAVLAVVGYLQLRHYKTPVTGGGPARAPPAPPPPSASTRSSSSPPPSPPPPWPPSPCGCSRPPRAWPTIGWTRPGASPPRSAAGRSAAERPATPAPSCCWSWPWPSARWWSPPRRCSPARPTTVRASKSARTAASGRAWSPRRISVLSTAGSPASRASCRW
ncbi:ABC transporter permease [Catenulispora yoronensis]